MGPKELPFYISSVMRRGSEAFENGSGVFRTMEEEGGGGGRRRMPGTMEEEARSAMYGIMDYWL